jgi:23S rRNA (adenine2030-N6)-methyltransferase
MLSYRHAFHAGNHADVLKHAVLVQLLKYLALKDKPFWYIDTHAGAGAYALDEGFAQKNAEFDSGITRLWNAADVPPLLAEYLAEVRVLNPHGTLRYYPGSPYLAWQMLRPDDRLRLFELHSTEINVLRHNFRDAGKRALLFAEDGFDGLKSMLPPQPRRGLVLIDPSYEDKRDYARTLVVLQDGLKRFATGTYAVWHPLVARPEAQRFGDQLKRLRPRGWLHVTLSIGTRPANGVGLFGSGLFVLNPPYTLEAQLKASMPYLVKALGQDESAQFTLEYRGD